MAISIKNTETQRGIDVNDDSWRVFMAAVDFLVCSGDASAVLDQFSDEQIREAIRARDAISTHLEPDTSR